MNLKKSIVYALCMSAALYGCTNGNKAETSDNGFRYTIDEFADLKIMRYRIPGWDSLTFNQKSLIYHLGEAAKYGWDITWDQNCKYNLDVRRLLEKIIRDYDGDRSSAQWEQFMVYAKRVFFSTGIHHHYAEDKSGGIHKQDDLQHERRAADNPYKHAHYRSYGLESAP